MSNFYKILSVLGLLISSYLYFSSVNISYCPVGECDIVAKSSYSYIGNIPISLIGILGYLIILNYFFFFKKSKRYLHMGFTIIGTAFLFSLYLIYISIFKINAVCFWCTLSFVIIAFLFISINIELKKLNNIRVNQAS
ncbi:vitamin K epoxide reductase family protein [Metabacillus fastidiosus]|uniref:vitamin K epoxide reductase family protein n=1 Tax=Metabacillus fastidiosus TaxID=1458 RepID=UPI003AF32845